MVEAIERVRYSNCRPDCLGHTRSSAKPRGRRGVFMSRTHIESRRSDPDVRRAEKLRRRARRVGEWRIRTRRDANHDHRPERREHLVSSRSPLGLSEPLHGLTGAGWGSGDLVDVQRPLAEGLLPRPAVAVVPGGLDSDPGRGLDCGGPPDGCADRLPVVPGYGDPHGGALRAHGLRRLQGQPGGGLSLPLRGGHGRGGSQDRDVTESNRREEEREEGGIISWIVVGLIAGMLLKACGPPTSTDRYRDPRAQGPRWLKV